MKKFMKTCAVLALILIVAGTGMSLVAGAIQGPITISQLRNSIHLDDELGEEIFAKLENLEELKRLDSGVRFSVEDGLNGEFDSKHDILSGDIKQSFSPDDEGIRNLDIAAGGCSVVLEDSDDDDFHVEVKRAKAYQGYVNDGTLYLKCIRKSTVNGTDGCKIVLSIPEEYAFDDVEIALGAGEFTGKNTLQASKMEIELGAGTIELKDLDVSKFEAEVGAGSLEIKGDIREKAEVECAMGSIEMKLAGEMEDYNFNVSVAMGDISIGGRSYSGMDRSKEIDNEASRTIDLECAMGSIEVKFAK